MLTRRQQGH